MIPANVRVATDADRPTWDAFVDASPLSEAAHLWGYQDLIAERFGAAVHRLVVERDGRMIGCLPLVFQKSLVGRFLTSVPYLTHAGVLSTDVDARAALATAAAELADRLGAQRLEIRGKAGGDLPLPTWDGKAGYSLDLRPGRDALWQRLRSKVRAQVRRPIKEGYSSRSGGGESTSDFYPVFARRWHELGSPVLPRRFFEGMVGLFGERMVYVLVEKGGRVAAAGVLINWKGRVEIPWAASSLELNRFGVNMLLYWTSIEKAIDMGGDEFDFGRSTPDTGNAKFKLQWGSAESPLVWNVRVDGRHGQVAERGDRRRDLVARTWSRLPRFITGRLGPCLAARIPY